MSNRVKTSLLLLLCGVSCCLAQGPFGVNTVPTTDSNTAAVIEVIATQQGVFHEVWNSELGQFWDVNGSDYAVWTLYGLQTQVAIVLPDGLTQIDSGVVIVRPDGTGEYRMNSGTYPFQWNGSLTSTTDVNGGSGSAGSLSAVQMEVKQTAASIALVIALFSGMAFCWVVVPSRFTP